MNLLKSEIRKLIYTKTFWYLTLSAVALAVLSTAPTPYILTSLSDFGSLSNVEVVDSVYANAISSYIFVIIMGILIMAGEFRHGTAVATFLASPKRSAVLVAKVVVAMVAGMFVMLLSTGFGFIAGAIALSFYPEAVEPSSGVFVNSLLAAVLSGAVLAMLGVAVGSLIKNQLVAVVITLVWLFLVEPILLVLLVSAGKYLPTGLITGILSLDVGVTDPGTGLQINTGDYLDALPASLLLVSYGLVFTAVALGTSLRKDIN